MRTIAAVVLGTLAWHAAFATPEAFDPFKSDVPSLHGTAARLDSPDVIHAFALSVAGLAARPDSADGIHAFGLDTHGDSDRVSVQIRRDKPGA